jgi:hypothetical protein
MNQEAVLKLALSDTPKGFALFYTLLHDQEPPEHTIKWISALYDAKRAEKGLVVEAFRGSTKSTTMATFVAYRIGLYPDSANLIIQAGDERAQDTAAKIADFIENNPVWRAVFPSVVPDKVRGWGAMGYEVMREDMDYEEWRRLCSERRDPTLLGVGYKSQSIIGMHPSGVLLVDDIHTEENTSSDRELQKVRKIVTGTIFPTRRPNNPWTIFIGTPWVEDDVIQAVKATGEYIHLATPVYKGDGKPAWPEFMDEKQIESERRQDITGGLEFARMFLLDLSAAERRVFSYHNFPSHLIQASWPFIGGVDYAGVADPSKRNLSQSHFALAYVAKMPGGGAVVFDGVLEQCSQAESEQYVRSAQDMFPDYLMSVVEGDGKGEEFYQVLYRHPELKLLPLKTGGKGKAERLVRQMGPWLRSGRVRISDAETKFLSHLRHFLNVYPNVSEHDPGYDAADAVYWGLRGMPDVLVMPLEEEELPEFFRETATYENPWSGLAEQHL